MKKILNVIAGVAKKAAGVALSLVGKGVSLGLSAAKSCGTAGREAVRQDGSLHGHQDEKADDADAEGRHDRVRLRGGAVLRGLAGQPERLTDRKPYTTGRCAAHLPETL